MPISCLIALLEIQEHLTFHSNSALSTAYSVSSFDTMRIQATVVSSRTDLHPFHHHALVAKAIYPNLFKPFPLLLLLNHNLIFFTLYLLLQALVAFLQS